MITWGTSGEPASEALEQEIQSAIEDIRKGGSLSACKAHDHLARGLIVLLRCQLARLRQDNRTVVVAGRVGAIMGGIIAGIVVGVAKTLGLI